MSAGLSLDQVLLGRPVELRGVPRSVQFHTTEQATVRPVFMALLKNGHLPAVEPRPGETPERYFARVLDAWAEYEHEYLSAELSVVKGGRLRLTADMCDQIPVELTDFHAYLNAVHPWLAGSVIAQVTAAGRGGLEFYSALCALRDEPKFQDLPRFWKGLREQAAAALKCSPQQVTNRQLRRYADQQRIWTPRTLERHLTHWTGRWAVAAERRPLAHSRIVTLLAPHPEQARAYAELCRHLEAARYFNDELIALTGPRTRRACVAVLDGDENGATLLQERQRHWAHRYEGAALDVTVTRRGAARLTAAADVLSSAVQASINVLECLSGWPEPRGYRAPAER